MSKITRIAQFTVGNPDIPNITITKTLTSTGTTIYLSNALPISPVELAKADAIVVAITSAGVGDTKAGYTGVFYADVADYDDNDKTITNFTRLIQYGSEYVGDSTIEADFPAGSRVECTIPPQLINQIIEVLLGEREQIPRLRVFADTTARDAEITSATEGMMCYVTGPGVQVYNGSAWVTL
jgi:hypothetical protein